MRILETSSFSLANETRTHAMYACGTHARRRRITRDSGRGERKGPSNADKRMDVTVSLQIESLSLLLARTL